jgi:transcriptional regulator with XRE-family HTH domain
MPRLAAQLNHLFATVPRSPGGPLWTIEDAAAAMTEAGVTMSAAYLSQLRTGKRDNPSARHLAALARLFEVPMEYFFDETLAAKIDQDLDLLAGLKAAGVRTVALRTQAEDLVANLSEVAAMLKHVSRLEDGRGEGPDGHPNG